MPITVAKRGAWLDFRGRFLTCPFKGKRISLEPVPRANRYLLPGYIYHLTHRCHDREEIERRVRGRQELKKEDQGEGWVLQEEHGTFFGAQNRLLGSFEPSIPL